MEGAHTTRPWQLLVVDDDEGLLHLMAETLRREGYGVETTRHGQTAIEWLALNSADLLLLDLQLADLSSVTVIERLREEGTDIPFIAVAGQGDERAAAEMMRGGAMDYLMKDRGLIELLPAIVQRVLGMVERERRLEREVLEISEEERGRIGRDLHDGLGQRLTALEFLCHALARQARTKAPELEGELHDFSRQVREAIKLTRQLSHGLAPISFKSDGLCDALRELTALTNSTETICDFDCDPPRTPTADHTAINIYRIAQEAVTNALRYSQATTIRMRLYEHPGRVELIVEDNGRGFPQPHKNHGGMGLQVMRYRARLIGGRLRITTKPGLGVRISCSAPKSL